MFLQNKKVVAGFVSLALLSLIITPSLLFAANAYTPLVTCDGSVANPCNFNALITMVNRIINWVISISAVIFAVTLIYGGYLYITSGGDTGKQGEARGIITNTLYGFVIILVSWLIVYTILKALVPDGSTIFKFIGNR